MRTLVVGDVHGCSQELASLLEVVQPDRVVLVGDLFTKGPDPVGVWRQIRQGGFQAVLGNHDQRVVDAVAGRRRSASARACGQALTAFDPFALEWLRALPLFLPLGSFWVVHAGLHPSGDLEQTTKRMAIAMRYWQDGSDNPPFWYDVYQGERGVIFGHDARRGLVRRERAGRPWIVGLDTGCVYGGSLSGYVVEEDRIVQVPSKEVYCPIRVAPEVIPR